MKKKNLFLTKKFTINGDFFYHLNIRLVYKFFFYQKIFFRHKYCQNFFLKNKKYYFFEFNLFQFFFYFNWSKFFSLKYYNIYFEDLNFFSLKFIPSLKKFSNHSGHLQKYFFYF